MKHAMICFVCAAYFQIGPIVSSPNQADSHSDANPDTILVTHFTTPGSAFYMALSLASENRLPLGIVLNGGSEDPICQANISVPNEVTIKSFVTAVNNELPQYRASLVNGVLLILPLQMSRPTAELLNLRLDFKSRSMPHKLMVSGVWMFVRAILAPAQATVGGGMVSSAAENAPEIDLVGQSLENILNTIAQKGSGAVWIFRSSLVTRLDQSTPRPFEMYAYNGEKDRIEALKCRQ